MQWSVQLSVEEFKEKQKGNYYYSLMLWTVYKIIIMYT